MRKPKRWLVAGASGLLGVRLVRYLVAQERAVVALHARHALPAALAPFGRRVNLLQGEVPCRRAVDDSAPDVVVNCVGLTNVDQCEREPALAASLNTDVAGRLAAAAHASGARYVHISTDHLWDGTHAFVSEDEPPRPINVYARTKAKGESAVLRAHPDALVVRTNFFGPSLPWRKSFNDWLTDQLTNGMLVNAFVDVFFTPVVSDLLSAMIVELVDLDVSGILNVAGSERISKYEFAMRWAAHQGVDSALIRAGSVTDCNLAAPRPNDMSLDCAKAAEILGRSLPTLDDSLRAYGRAAASSRS